MLIKPAVNSEILIYTATATDGVKTTLLAACDLGTDIRLIRSRAKKRMASLGIKKIRTLTIRRNQ